VSHYDSHIPTMARNLHDHLDEQASNAESYAEEGGNLRSAHALHVGAVAFLQHGLGHARRLLAARLEECVRSKGMTAEHIAEGLAEHNVTTTAEQLRATFPQITVMERQVRWMIAHADEYLPLLHRVSRIVPAWPGLVRHDHHREAEQTHRLVAATLVDTGWDGTRAGLSEVDSGLLMMYAPTACPWLSRVVADVLPHGLVREAVQALQDMVEDYYDLGRDDAAAAPVVRSDDMTVDPFDVLHQAVHGADAGDIALHAVQPATR